MFWLSNLVCLKLNPWSREPVEPCGVFMSSLLSAWEEGAVSARTVVLAVVTLAMVVGTACGDPLDPQWVKWSQLPNMTVNGYDFSSETLVPSTVADDFQCNDPRPVTDVHWWGSYYTTGAALLDHNSDNYLDPSFPAPGAPPVMPNIVAGFNITFYADVPTGVDPNMPFSHPGAVLGATQFVNMSVVGSNLHGTIDRDNSGVVGDDGDEAVWQYNVELPVPFNQTLGTIYWISIQAVNEHVLQNPNSVQWGWHESLNQWQDAAVQNGPQALWGNQYSQEWANLLVKDMAFELSIPEPATMALLGWGLTFLIVMPRRRK